MKHGRDFPAWAQRIKNSEPKNVLLHLSGVGLVYTETFDKPQPTYYTVNSGSLSTPIWGVTPYQAIERFFVTPSGAIYAYRMRGWGPPNAGTPDHYGFVARASAPGADFVTILDPVIITVPPGYYDVCGISCGSYNPNVPDTAMFLVEDRTSVSLGTRNQAVYIGSGGSLSVGYRGVPGTGGGSNLGGSISFGFGKWLYVQGTVKYFFSEDGVTKLSNGSATLENGGIGSNEYIVRASQSGALYSDGPGTGDLKVSLDNLDTITTRTFGTNFAWTGFDTDSSGQMCMGRYDGTMYRAKSSDYGQTWTVLNNLPSGNWRFKWAGAPDTIDPFWIAVGTTVKYSSDFGASWADKTSPSLLAIDPTPDVLGIQVIR